MLLPVLPLETVFHVGALAGARPNPHSLEASALSVSLCPAAWRRIARLGGQPVWRLHRQGARFLDGIQLDSDPDAEAVRRGRNLGLLAPACRWRVWSLDTETDTAQFMEVADEAAARSELDLPAGAPIPETTDEEGRRAERVRTIAPTPRLLRRLGLPEDCAPTSAIAFDWYLLTLAEDAGLDGVYWRETHDPAALSAPRAAIVQPRVGQFAATRLDTAAVPDDATLLARLPRPILQSLTPSADA